MRCPEIVLGAAAALLLLGALGQAGDGLPPPLASGSAAAGGRRRPRPPLLDGNERQRGLKQTHCHFGNQTYELEERWRPDLGPPFGVLYCVRCECVALQRKKRIVARARCENIKNGCPKPACETPVLLPERCCKVCPGEDGAGLEEDLVERKLESDDEDKNVKEFSVLLTGRGLSSTSSTSGAARAYLTFNKRSLHYSVHSANLERATVVRFMDDDETILEEHEVPSPHHHVNSSKVCGVWKKVPKVYRRLLLKERLVMALASERHPDGIVAGKILRNMRINKEIFSSLLIPGYPKAKPSVGGGGVAMISTERNCIYIVLEFSGIFLPTDSHNVPVYIQLLREDPEEGKQVIVSSTVALMPKVHPEFNTVNVKVDLGQEAQLQMALSQLRLRVSARDQGLYLHGTITPKVTCNVFQATLTGGMEAAVGQVALQTSDGTLSYQMQVSNAKDLELPFTISLEAEDTSKKELWTMVVSNDSQVQDNTIRGTFPAVVEQTEMLFADDLFLSLTTEHSNGVHKLTGRIRQRLYIDAFVNEVPLMLLPVGNTNSSSVGQAWLTLNKECDLHYALYTSGLVPGMAEEKDREEKERHILEVQETPRYGPTQQKLLQRLNVDEVEGIQEDMSFVTLARMKAGQTALVVSSKAPGRPKIMELKTKVQHVPVPITCLPSKEVTQETGEDFVDDESNDIQGSDPSHRCFYEGEIYMDGAQWKAQHDHCTMCSCQRGRVVCDKILCAPTPCENPVTMPDQCCSVCLAPGESAGNSTSLTAKAQRGCYFEGDKTYHLAGSSWHPYIPPFGFSRCALCTCQTGTLGVECKRITCPPLPCPEKEAFREHPLACCKQCPSVQTNVVRLKELVIPGQLGDQGSQKTYKEILSAGGCEFRGQFYANGDSWHPTVQPYGEMKCINCHCKDNKSRCKRQRCPTLTCAVRLSSDKDCCSRCAESTTKRKGSSSSSSTNTGQDRRPEKGRKAKERKVQDAKGGGGASGD